MPGSASQMTSPMSRYDARSHHNLAGLVVVITVSVISVVVFVLVLILAVCLFRRRRRHLGSKPPSAIYCSPRHDADTMTSHADKYNCRVEAMRAAVNHRDVGVANNSSKTLVRPLDSSPRLGASSGRILLVADTTPSCGLHCNNTTVDSRLTTFNHTPSLNHVTSYWTNGSSRPVAS